jgi:phenylacetate-CoA ligase
VVENNYYNRKIETLAKKDLKEVQFKRLKTIIHHSYSNSSFYKKKFDTSGLKPSDITNLDDIRKIPFTVKTDLRDNYPLGMMATKINEVVEIHASSGTTGNPIIGPYTNNDVKNWKELMARTIYTAGGRKSDIIHNAYGYGLFTGGLGFHYGAQELGSLIVPISGGMTQRQIKLMKDLQATILCCTPSFAVYLAETMAKEGIDPRKELKLRVGLFGAEPWSEKTRERIQEELGLEAFDIYGLTELCGPGVSVECSQHDGLHIWEDHFLVETIDPKTGEVLSPGEVPMLRFRTRDISIIQDEICECGRTHSRMLKIRGRSDDMLIIRGVNVFPSQVENVLMSFSELATQYQIIVDRPGALDTFAVKVELKEQIQQTHLNQERLKAEIKNKIRDITGLSAAIEIVKYGELPRSAGKAKHVIDFRKGKL